MNDHPLEDLFCSFLAQKDIKKESWDLYNTILNQNIDYLIKKNIIYAKTSHIKTFIKMKIRMGYIPSWIHHIIIVIKDFYKYLSLNQMRLSLEEVYAYNIALDIKNEPLMKGLSKDVLTSRQAKALILKTKENRRYVWHYRGYAIMRNLCYISFI